MSESETLSGDTVEELAENYAAVRSDLHGVKNGQYVRFETMLESLLADESDHIAGDTSGPTSRNLSCVITALRGGDESDVFRLESEHTKTELWDELHTALIDIGLTDDDGNPLLSFMDKDGINTRNIGPIAFFVLAWAETVLDRDIAATHAANIGVIEASESWGVKSGWDYE